MRSPSAEFGPPPRDELVSWSDAPLAHDRLSPIPALAAGSPPAHTVSVAGTDVLVRVTAATKPATTDVACYVHGLDGSSDNWNRLAAALAHRARGIAPDLPGEGLTAPPRSGRYSVIAEADLCAAVIRRASGGPVHLVGNSRGGVVATYLAARHPALVRTLTLIAPAVPDFRMTRDRGADVRLGAVMLPGVRRPLARRLARVSAAQWAARLAVSCFGEPGNLTAADLAAAEAVFARRAAFPWSGAVPIDALRSLIRAQLRPGRWSYDAAARQVHCPVLVVWGTRDRLVDARLARPTAQGFDDSRLLMLPRVGHVAQMEQPEPVARAMLALWDGAGSAAVPGAPDRVSPANVGA